MSLKKVLYKNHGIVLKESESKYFNFLVKTKEDKSYKELLKQFSDNCTTRYFKRSKINLIANQLLKLELPRQSQQFVLQKLGTQPQAPSF